MTIGRYACKHAVGTHLREAIAITLDDATTALEESFYDLTDEQAWGFPIPGRNNLAWIVMHCLDNLDESAVEAQTGARLFRAEWRWDLWGCKPEERPKPGDAFSPVAEMLDRLRRIREAAAAAVVAAFGFSARKFLAAYWLGAFGLQRIIDEARGLGPDDLIVISILFNDNNNMVIDGKIFWPRKAGGIGLIRKLA